MHNQSPALVISIVALVAALAVAGLALTGVLETTGPAGPAGVAGAQGAVGPAGASAVSYGLDVKATILKVDIGSDRRPVVTFKLTDEKGTPLKISDLDGNPRFGMAALKVDTASGLSQYLSYYVNPAVAGRSYLVAGVAKQPALATAAQAGLDPVGKYTDSGNGVFLYTFNQTLPEGYDRTATHMLAGQITRGARTYVDNPIYFFVPAGGAVTVNRLASSTATCNQCHDPLALHGGGRQEFALCLLCHNPQTTDPESGNTVDFKVMIHKIHSGKTLPSTVSGKSYEIIGFSQSYFNFSEVGFPDEVRDCVKCHTGPQGDVWKTSPSRSACGSCHDDVNFATGAGHIGGIATSDLACKLCHGPTMGQEFDASIPGSHVIPDRSSQLPGVNFNIVKITNTAPGQNPVVVFNIKNDKGASMDPLKMTSLAFYMAGPTTDYNTRISETNIQRKPTNFTLLTNGDYQYTFGAAIPSTATGSYAIAIQGYKAVNITAPATYAAKTSLINVRDVGFNKIVYVPVTDNTAVARRTVVTTEKCEVCHTRIDFIHGGSRQAAEFCSMCHNPTFFANPPAGSANGTLPTALDFKSFMHKVHSGEDATNPARVGSAFNTADILFPGDRRNCVKCHVTGANLLPMKPSIQGNTYLLSGKAVKTNGPITSACSGCHDTPAATGHMALQTISTTVSTTLSTTVETCNVCHAENRQFSVSTAHARP